jgi:hypothetical protein
LAEYAKSSARFKTVATVSPGRAMLSPALAVTGLAGSYFNPTSRIAVTKRFPAARPSCWFVSASTTTNSSPP